MMLQKVIKEDRFPSLRCMRCPKIEIFFEMFRANLQSLVWSHHVGVSTVGHQYGGRKIVLTSRTYFGYLGH